jgi:hypothetical protein
MKKLLAGGLALGFVGVGAALIATPGGAQEEEPGFDFIENLDADLTPTTVSGGETVTVTSIDGCPTTDEVVEPFTKLVWGVGAPGWLDLETFEGEVVDEGETALNEDGSWSFTLTAPSAPGDYEVFAVCATDDVSIDDEGAVVAEAAETLGGHHGGGDDDGGEECPPVDDAETAGALGGDHTPPSTECPPPTSDTTQPPTSDTTQPPEEEIGIWYYGPEAFTVTAGATPVPETPENFG